MTKVRRPRSKIATRKPNQARPWPTPPHHHDRQHTENRRTPTISPTTHAHPTPPARTKPKITPRKPNQDTDPTTHNPTPKPAIYSNPRNSAKTQATYTHNPHHNNHYHGSKSKIAPRKPNQDTAPTAHGPSTTVFHQPSDLRHVTTRKPPYSGAFACLSSDCYDHVMSRNRRHGRSLESVTPRRP